MEKKNQIKIYKVMLVIVLSFMILPIVSAYPASLPAYDLYTVFVESVFGGFWLSVLGLSIIFFILMGPIGGLSQFTVMHYCMIFIYAMAIGYMQILLILPIWISLIGWFAFQLFKTINSGSTS